MQIFRKVPPPPATTNPAAAPGRTAPGRSASGKPADEAAAGRPLGEASAPGPAPAAGTPTGLAGTLQQELLPSFSRLAFANPYNLSLLAGALAVAAIATNPVVAVVALGLEGLWMLHAPGSRRLRERFWEPRLEEARARLLAQQRAARLVGLSEADRGRVEQLVARQEQIRRLARENPSFTAELLRAELAKTDRLVDAFIDLALACARYEHYLAAVDGDALERDRRRYAAEAERGTGDPRQTEIARKNLAIIEKRIERLAEIRRYVGVARGQLDLIDNSFQLIADQIVTMESPQALSGQLDDLLDGVEAIRETARDTEAILGGELREP